MAVDWTKPIETRDGRKARYICEIISDGYSRVALISDCLGNETPETYMENGQYKRLDPDSDMNIINSPPPKVTVETNGTVVAIHRDSAGRVYICNFADEAHKDTLSKSENHLCFWKLPSVIEGEAAK